jgi:hypothetical protein
MNDQLQLEADDTFPLCCHLSPSWAESYNLIFWLKQQKIGNTVIVGNAGAVILRYSLQFASNKM